MKVFDIGGHISDVIPFADFNEGNGVGDDQSNTFEDNNDHYDTDGDSGFIE